MNKNELQLQKQNLNKSIAELNRLIELETNRKMFGLKIRTTKVKELESDLKEYTALLEAINDQLDDIAKQEQQEAKQKALEARNTFIKEQLPAVERVLKLIELRNSKLINSEEVKYASLSFLAVECRRFFKCKDPMNGVVPNLDVVEANKRVKANELYEEVIELATKQNSEQVQKLLDDIINIING